MVKALVVHIIEGDVGIEMVRLGLLFELGLERSQLLRILLRQVDAFGGIVVEVVELPRIFVKRRIRDYVLGFDLVGKGQFRLPSVVIDLTRAKDVVVLHRVMPRSIGIVE